MSTIDYYYNKIKRDPLLLHVSFSQVDKGISGRDYQENKEAFEEAQKRFAEIQESTIVQAAESPLSELKKTQITDDIVQVIRAHGDRHIGKNYVSEKYGISLYQAARILERVNWYLRKNPVPEYNDWEISVVVPSCDKFCKQRLFAPVDDGLTVGTYFETKQSILNFDNSMY